MNTVFMKPFSSDKKNHFILEFQKIQFFIILKMTLTVRILHEYTAVYYSTR